MANAHRHDFEAMTDPPLADRLRAFEVWLDAEPCTHPGNEVVFARMRSEGREPPTDFRGCEVISVSRRMCPACRLRLHFYHCLYNAEAYEGTSGAIPRRETS